MTVAMIHAHAVINGMIMDIPIDATILVGTFVCGLSIALIAAWFPARRAAKSRVIETLRFE